MKTSINKHDSQKEHEYCIKTPFIKATIKTIAPIVKKKKTGSGTLKNKATIFIIDDDVLFLKALEHHLLVNFPTFQIKTFQTGEDCLKQIKRKPDIVLLDYYLDAKIKNAQNGLAILKRIKEQNPSTRIIMLSSQESLTVAVKCIKNGAYDYIVKNKSAFDDIQQLIKLISPNTHNKDPFQISFFKKSNIFFN